jgi:D-inositol-3-phosphate glycosyltransferase
VADGRSGVLVDGHDAQAWAEAIQGLLDDEPRRRRLAEGALVHARMFGWDGTVDGLLDVYAQARSTPRRIAAGGLW